MAIEKQIIKKSYQFSCAQCGYCCSGEQLVLLNFYDIWKIAKFLKFNSAQELFHKGYLEFHYNEHNVYIPKIKFKTKPWKFCPFLVNSMEGDSRLKGSCSLHPLHKPLICSLAPLAREIDFSANKEQYFFIKPAPDCPGVCSKKTNYLKDIIQKYQLELELQKQFFREMEARKHTQMSKMEIIRYLEEKMEILNALLPLFY
jgi:Fe-S-cluster containining protein